MTTHEAPGDAYDVVSLKLSWASLSLLLFLASLPSPYLLTWQSWRPEQLWLWPLLKVAVIGLLALVGFITGLLGMREATRRGMAKVGLLLNGTVLGCIALVIAGMAMVLR